MTASSLRWAWCALFLACSAPAQNHGAQPSDAGLSLNLPDARAQCPDTGVAAAAMSAAGEAATATCTPTRPRRFTTEIAPLFGACSGEVCHNFTSTTLLATIGQPALECCAERSLIAAGDPEHSYLLDKLRGVNLCDGVRMPFEKPPLSDADIQAISDWICEGAPSTP